MSRYLYKKIQNISPESLNFQHSGLKLTTLGSDPNVVNFCGAGQMIKGFDAAVVDMEGSQIIDVHLMPEEAYGMADPNAIFTMEISQLPGSEDLTVGQQVYLSNQYGQPFPVKVTAKDNKNITFDANC